MTTTEETKGPGTVEQIAAPIKRILVPTDLTPQSDKAIEYGLTLAERFGAHLTLFYAFKESYASQYSRGQHAYDNSLMERNSYEGVLRAAGKKLRERYADCDTVFAYGEPDEEIVKVARQGEFDLIVISTHHYNWLTRLAFGSDADQILHDAPCPILLLQVDEDVDFRKEGLTAHRDDLSYALGSLF
jgi:nucleotide-binding universal stress UspA family protein